MSSSSSARDRAITPHFALIAVQVMFGTWPIFGKIVLRSMSSTSLVGFRICGAAIVFTLLQRKLSELLRLPKRVIAWLVLSSLLGVAVNQLLYVKGLSSRLSLMRRCFPRLFQYSLSPSASLSVTIGLPCATLPESVWQWRALFI